MNNINEKMLNKFETVSGFIAALDQSGGSTPKALSGYGIESFKDDAEMFDLIHGMRTRVMTSTSFDGERILGAILFEDTLNRTVDGLPTAQYLWEKKGIVSFLKIDKGMELIHKDCHRLKDIPNLDETLRKAKEAGVFGTKMRSYMGRPSASGMSEIVAQQFEIAKKVLSHGLVPIIEPEVDIHSEMKEVIETVLRVYLESFLDGLEDDQKVILKLTLPEKSNFYQSLVKHKNVLKVVALSGGYSQEEANKRLAENNGVSASFSRALLCDLKEEQNEHEFDATLNDAVEGIYRASIT